MGNVRVFEDGALLPTLAAPLVITGALMIPVDRHLVCE